MIKLLALDLDGTLLNSQGRISEQNLAAIRLAEDKGVLVSIATGRRYRDARPVGLEAGLNAPLITHNGALIKYADGLETVAFSLIDETTAREVVEIGRRFGGDPLLSTDPHGKGTLLYDRVSDNNIPLQKYLRWSETVHGDEANEAVIHVSDIENALASHEVIHISFSGACRPMLEFQELIAGELAGRVTVLATVYARRDFTLIDILPPGASKGTGVEKLATINGLAAVNVMAIGDNFNDLEMLHFAGTPVVMGNADPSLLERPEFYTTVSNEENGVAVAIEQFILNEETISGE